MDIDVPSFDNKIIMTILLEIKPDQIWPSVRAFWTGLFKGYRNKGTALYFPSHIVKYNISEFGQSQLCVAQDFKNH